MEKIKVMLCVFGIGSCMLFGCGKTEPEKVEETKSTEEVVEESSKDISASDLELENDFLEIVDYGIVLDGVNNSTREGYFVIYRAIKNNSDHTMAKGVRGTAYILDRDGNVCASEDTYIPYIKPGDTVVETKEITISGDSRIQSLGFTDSEFETVLDDPTLPNSSCLEFSGLSDERTEFDTYVRGKMTNISDVKCENIYLYVLFKKNGEIVGSSWEPTMKSLDPGQFTTFEVVGSASMEQYDSYDIYWQNVIY